MPDRRWWSALTAQKSADASRQNCANFESNWTACDWLFRPSTGSDWIRRSCGAGTACAMAASMPSGLEEEQIKAVDGLLSQLERLESASNTFFGHMCAARTERAVALHAHAPLAVTVSVGWKSRTRTRRPKVRSRERSQRALTRSCAADLIGLATLLDELNASARRAGLVRCSRPCSASMAHAPFRRT